jgi:outer membrane protein
MNKSDEDLRKIVFSRFLRKIAVFLLIAGCMVLFLGHQAWSGQEKNVLTSQLALELASKYNPVIMAADEQVKQSEAQLRQAKASRYPSLGTSLLYQRQGEEPVYPVFDLNGNPMGANAIHGFQTTYQAALDFTYLLYSGGAVKYNVQAKDLALGAVKASAERTRQSVDNGVYSAYYALQRARARLEVAEEAFELAKEHLREVNLFFKNGVVAKNQVLRVQVEVSDSELSRIKASNAVDVGWSGLERAVGTKLKDEYGLPEAKTTAKGFEEPADIHGLAYRSRPELKALEKSRLSALALSKAAAGQGGPQIVLQGQTYVVDDEFFPDYQNDWKVSIAANWKFYDGGESRAKSAEAEAAAMELLYRIEDLKKQIDLELSEALLNLRSSAQRVAVAENQVESAEEDYRMATKRYNSQVGTNIDVLDARVALTNARNQLVDSVYDVFQSRADLLFALGTDYIPHLE